MANQQQYWQFEIFGTDPDAIGFFGDAGIILPSGSTGERPSSPVIGHFRFNSQLSLFEGYNGGWVPFETGGIATFDTLADTPASKVGAANRVLIVNAPETDLEYSSALTLENTGRLRVPAAYEALVDADTVITNKKYTDDQDNLQLSLTGGLMGGNITMGSNAITGLPLSPTTASEATSKSYVDGLFAGIDRKESVNLATTTDLDTETGDTWVAAGSKVGKTITSNTNTATIDTVALVNGDRLLVKNEVGDVDNGIYDVSGVGGAVVVLTRSADTDGSPASEVNGGATTFVVFGTLNALTQWSVIANGVVDVDVDAMVWSPTGAVSGVFLELAGGTMVGSITMGSAGIQVIGDTSTATAPTYSFAGDLGTGLHQISGAGTMSLLVATAPIWNISATALTPAVNISQDIGSAGLKVKDIYADHHLPNFGAAGDPSYAFEGATTTGMYNDGAGGISFAIGGTDSIGIAGSNTITTPDGAAAGSAGLDMTLAAGSGHATSGDGGSINIAAGAATGSGDGGSVVLNVTAGAGVGADGSVSFQRDGTEFLNFAAGSGLITAPDGVDGGDIVISAGESTGAAYRGGIQITGGANNTAADYAQAGHVEITGGSVTSANDYAESGVVHIQGGPSSGAGSYGYNISTLTNVSTKWLNGGTVYAGDVVIEGGTSDREEQAGGGIKIGGGDVTGAFASGGGCEVTGGNSTGQNGGSVTVRGGVGDTGGGSATLRSGNGTSSGSVLLTVGTSTTGAPGNVSIVSGNLTAGTQKGGEVTIDAGDVTAAGTGDGGDITLTAGTSIAGSAGAIVIPDQTAPSSTTNKLYSVSGALTWNGIDLTANQYTEAFDDGDLTAGVIAITHSLGRQYTHVTVYDSSDIIVQPDAVTATSTSVSTIDLSSFGTISGTWNVVIS